MVVWNSLCKKCWPGTHGNYPSCASKGLRLKAGFLVVFWVHLLKAFGIQCFALLVCLPSVARKASEEMRALVLFVQWSLTRQHRHPYALSWSEIGILEENAMMWVCNSDVLMQEEVFPSLSSLSASFMYFLWISLQVRSWKKGLIRYEMYMISFTPPCGLMN